MRVTRRIGVFETNSSSIHACVILPENDYSRWKSDNLYVRTSTEEGHSKFKVMTENEIMDEFLDEYLNDLTDATKDNYDRRDFEDWLKWDKNVVRYENYKCDKYSDYYDSDIMTFLTPSGDVMVAASYYGYNG